MKPIKETDATALTWSRTGRKDSQLLAGEDVVATLTWLKDWRTQATGESSDDNWTLRREGLLHPRVVAKVRSIEVEAANARLSWGGSVNIEVARGGEYRLQSASMRNQEWVLTDSKRNKILGLQWAPFRKCETANVILEPGARDVPALALLNVLSWYLVLLVSYDYDAGAIAASVVAGAI